MFRHTVTAHIVRQSPWTDSDTRAANNTLEKHSKRCPVPILLQNCRLHILFLSEQNKCGILWLGFDFIYLFIDWVMKDSWIMFRRENSHHLKCMDGRCSDLTCSQSGKQTGKVIEIHCFCMRVICYQIRSRMPIPTRTRLFQTLN